LTLRQKRLRLLAIAVAAALIAGSITGTLLTIEDEAWPGRGGLKAVWQISLLFSGYAFLVALPVGGLLSTTLSPALLRFKLASPLPNLVVGSALGLLVHLTVDVSIQERIDAPEDFLGGIIAGGAAGLLWWFAVQRHEKRALLHG
jgi:hypothetical protein